MGVFRKLLELGMFFWIGSALMWVLQKTGLVAFSPNLDWLRIAFHKANIPLDIPYLPGSDLVIPFAAGVAAIPVAGLLSGSNPKMEKVCQLGNMKWSRNDFCRGWLITGGTGSGKTEFIKVLLHELFINEKGERGPDGKYLHGKYPWGGISIDAKGDFNDIVIPMAEHYGRGDDIVLLKTRPDGAPEDWKPKDTFNLLSDYAIPANTYATTIVETAMSVAGGEGDKGFFKTQGESNIGWAIELYRAIREAQIKKGLPEKEWVFPTLKNILLLLTDKKNYEALLESTGADKEEDHLENPSAIPEEDDEGFAMEATGLPYIDHMGNECDKPRGRVLYSEKLQECLDHFNNRYWSQPKDQLGGVQGTIYNYLSYFAGDDVAEVFCTTNTVDFADIEKGRIICLSMPQKLRAERRYINTVIKLLFYQQALRRFDRSTKKGNNLLLALQDEAQKFINKDDGEVDVLRASSTTTIIATQSKTSLYPPLGGKEKGEPIILNLRNRVIFTAADLQCAEGSAYYIGKRILPKISVSKGGGGGNSRSISKEEQFIIEPSGFMELKKFTAIVGHSDGRWRKYVIAPLDNEGKRPFWWPLAVKEAGLKRVGFWLTFGIDRTFTKVKHKIGKS
jgi:hypothetical protein